MMLTNMLRATCSCGSAARGVGASGVEERVWRRWRGKREDGSRSESKTAAWSIRSLRWLL